MSLLKNIFKKEDTPAAKKTKAEPAAKASQSAAPVKAEKAASTHAKANHRLQRIVRPVVTEKSAMLSALNKYVFEVAPSMNKIEIYKAIKEQYGVDATNVHIVKVSGKKVRYGRVSGTTSNWKKAYVTLKPGDKIEVYEGV